jgi:hypothetical protein
MRRSFPVLTILVATTCMLHADTIVTKDRVSINGKFKKMVEGEITLVAGYDSGDKTLTVRKTDIAIIEFNSSTYNSGAPKPAIGLGPPLKGGGSSDFPSEKSDTIVLWLGMQHRPCKLIGIDGQHVQCGGKSGNYDRDRN